jgi:hypothetical protein
VEDVANPRLRGRTVDWFELLARAGLVAKGCSYALVGVLAIGVALGLGGHATSRQGALHELAGTAFGKLVLVALAAGFAAYALWRVLQAVREDGWAKRLGYVGRAVVYAGLASSAGKIVAGAGGGQSQNEKAHKTTAVALSWPGGPWLVGIAGLAVIGVGVWNLYRGLSRSFADKWTGGGETRTWGVRAGMVGHCARFVVFALIGVFALKAAVDYNPQDAVGLDGALQKLAHESYGEVLLGLTAAGLLAYALYCFVDARYRDPSA